jgi:hypothetical protein
LWFEEKLKRRKDGNPFMDDDALEKQLALEWDQEDISIDSSEEMVRIYFYCQCTYVFLAGMYIGFSCSRIYRYLSFCNSRPSEIILTKHHHYHHIYRSFLSFSYFLLVGSRGFTYNRIYRDLSFCKLHLPSVNYID